MQRIFITFLYYFNLKEVIIFVVVFHYELYLFDNPILIYLGALKRRPIIIVLVNPDLE